MKRITRRLSLLFLWIVAACGPSVTPAPQPAPRLLIIETTVTLQPLAEVFNRCIEEQPGSGIIVVEQHASALSLTPTPGGETPGLQLRWGLQTNPSTYAAVLGEEELVFITHTANPVDHLALADLQAIYTGRLRTWPTSSLEAQPWAYLAGEDVQEVFESALLEPLPQGEQAAFLAPDPKAMREAVSENPQAVGFLPRRWLDATVKEISIDGLDPARLRRPYIALSPEEPEGLEKTWLLCVQNGIENEYNRIGDGGKQ